MEMIRETRRRIIKFDDYSGMCNACGTPFETKNLIAVEIYDKEDKALLIPIDLYYCPHCSKTVEYIYVYKNLDVTEELKKSIKNDK